MLAKIRKTRNPGKYFSYKLLTKIPNCHFAGTCFVEDGVNPETYLKELVAHFRKAKLPVDGEFELSHLPHWGNGVEF